MKPGFDAMYFAPGPVKGAPAQMGGDSEKVPQAEPADVDKALSSPGDSAIGSEPARTALRDSRPAWLPAIGSARSADTPTIEPTVADAVESDAGRNMPAELTGAPAGTGSEIGASAVLLAPGRKPVPRDSRATLGGGILSLRGGRRGYGRFAEDSEAISGTDDRAWQLAMAAVDGKPQRDSHPPVSEPLPDGSGRHLLDKCCRHKGAMAGDDTEALGMTAGYCLRMRRPCRFHRS